MQTETNKTELVAPSGSKTKMVAGTPTTVKLEVVRRVQHGDQLFEPGATLEVSHDEAKKLLTLSVAGQYDFSGEVNHEATKPRLYYYKLLREKTPEDELESLQRS